MLKILIVDDEKISRIKIKNYLNGHQIVEAHSFSEAIQKLADTYDVAFIDLNLDDSSTELFGLEVLKLSIEKGIYSVIMSGVEDEAIIEHAYELGCNDFYSKGNEKQSINDTLNRYLLNKNDHLEKYLLGNIFPTKSERQLESLKHISSFIETQVPIFLYGETGIGKTYLAKKIHELSKRNGNFVEINCAALSEELLESELFGYKKGAYTGAGEEQKGKLALAHKGTLFLDEIGSMSLSMQNKLLKAIEEKSFYQMNSDKVVHSDFRVISATLDNLEDKIKNGKFRFDLYQRICGLNVVLLPLRERKEDILDLIKAEFLQFEANESRKIILSKEAKDLLLNYSWPGNMRELKRVVSMLVVGKKGLIDKSDVSRVLTGSFDFKSIGFVTHEMINYAKKFGLLNLIEEIEKEVVFEVYKENQNKVRKTMTLLNVNQAKIYKYTKIEQINIE